MIRSDLFGTTGTVVVRVPFGLVVSFGVVWRRCVFPAISPLLSSRSPALGTGQSNSKQFAPGTGPRSSKRVHCCYTSSSVLICPRKLPCFRFFFLFSENTDMYTIYLGRICAPCETDVAHAGRPGGVPNPARPHLRTSGREHRRREAAAVDG